MRGKNKKFVQILFIVLAIAMLAGTFMQVLYLI